MKDHYRIVLVADTHIGAERSPKWRGLNITPEQYDRPFNEALEWADNNDADLTIVAGDLYHSRSPLPNDYRRAKTILNWVQGKPNNTTYGSLIVAGNHDIGVAGDTDALWSELTVARGKPSVFTFGSPTNAIQVLTLPWPRPTDWPAASSESMEETILATGREVLRQLNTQANELNPDRPAILVGHAMVSKGVRHGAGVVREPMKGPGLMLGKDVVLKLSDLEALPNIGGIYLGHVHDASIKPYIGSTQPTDWGDLGQKSFTVVDITWVDNAWAYETRQIPYATSLKLWNMEVQWDEAERLANWTGTAALPPNPDGIRCTVKADPGVKVPVDWIRETLGRLGTVHSVNVEYPPTLVARVESVDGQSLTVLPESEMADLWLDQAEIEHGDRRDRIMREFERMRELV